MNGNIMLFQSRIQSAKKPNVQIIGETDALLSHPSEVCSYTSVRIYPD